MLNGAALDAAHVLILAALVALYLRDRLRERDLELVLRELSELRRLLAGGAPDLRDE